MTVAVNTARGFSFLLVLMGVLFPLSAFAAAPIAADAAHRASRDILSNSDIQSTMPSVEEQFRAEPSAIAEFFANILRVIAPYFNSIMELVMWLALLVGTILLLILVALEVRNYLARLRGETHAPGDGQSTAEDTLDLDTIGTLADADQLAEAGDFAGAVRILLFRSLDAVRLKIDKVIFPFLTSRELLEVAPLVDTARHELQAVISIEELSHFGGRALDKSAYTQCRSSFLRFVDECGGSTG